MWNGPFLVGEVRNIHARLFLINRIKIDVEIVSRAIFLLVNRQGNDVLDVHTSRD